jgi:hypothetical protein
MSKQHQAHEDRAAYALYCLEVTGAGQEYIDIVWNNEESVRKCYLELARAVIMAWLGMADAVESEEKKHTPPEQRVCIDVLAACEGRDISHVCCALIVAAADKIADANQNRAQETLLSYLNFNNALLDAQRLTLDELFKAEGKENPTNKLKEFFA